MRRETKKAELKERLYETALERFRAHGYEATRVREITERAHVAKGTFFNHFPTKDHLLREWYRRETVSVLQRVRARPFADARRGIEALLEELIAIAERDPELYAMKERHAFAGDLLSDEERELDGELVAFLVERIEAARDAGALPPAPAAPFLAATIVTLLTGTAHEWVIAQHEFALRPRVLERVGFLLDLLERA